MPWWTWELTLWMTNEGAYTVRSIPRDGVGRSLRKYGPARASAAAITVPASDDRRALSRGMGYVGCAKVIKEVAA